MDEENQAPKQENVISDTHKKIRLPFWPNLIKTATFLKNHWGIIAVILIVVLGVYVRTLDYRWPYLRNIDSYNFMRDMELIIENNGVFPGYDPLMLAPGGAYKSAGSYSYLGAYSYILFSVFSPTTPLWQFLIWYPAFLASLLAIPAYFITKKLYDKKAGVFAALLIVFDVSVMARTLGGDPDNDNIVLLLPLIIITAFVYLQDYISKKNRLSVTTTAYSVLLGVMLSVWVWTWGGYWFVIWIMLGFLIMKIIIEAVHTRSARNSLAKFKIHAASLVIALLVMIVIITAFVNNLFITSLYSSLATAFHFADIKSEQGMFPNVYVSVAELQSIGGIGEIVKRVGPPFFTTLLCIIYLSYSYIKTKRHLNTIILLAIWFIGPVLATLLAVRFTILFATPMAIGTGILFSKIIRIVTGEDKSLTE